MQNLKHLIEGIIPLAHEYYKMASRPLGVTGEIGEYKAADKLKLNLAPARTPGYDATGSDG